MNNKLNYKIIFWVTLLSPLLFGISKIDFSPSSIGIDFTSKSNIKSHLKKMIFMEGGLFTMGSRSGSYIKMTASDSSLILTGMPSRVEVDPYYISATEVTNGEWREFYTDKEMELGKKAARREFYPDTTLWVNRFGVPKDMVKHYLSISKFQDHPVSGITWNQANEFCKWKSNKLKTLLTKKGIVSSITFRLPTEKEWEYAAIREYDKSKMITKISVYPWSQKNAINKLNELTNIGQIYDVNNVLLKNYDDDGCLYTCKVASYPPNNKGMYDMGGNVSEWTSDKAVVKIHYFKNDKRISIESLIDVENEIEKFKMRLDVDDQDGEAKNYLECLHHDRIVFGNTDLKICKGGSWANGMIYAQSGSRQAIGRDKPLIKLGFRIAISKVDQEVIKYFPKKNWKPKY